MFKKFKKIFLEFDKLLFRDDSPKRLPKVKGYMEHNLNMPIKELLRLMQERSFVSTYFGVPAIKSPVDFWIYQEIIYQTRPDVIIEIGNSNGGSTLAMAHILDNLNHGKIIGVDINHKNIPGIVKNHPRIKLITGDVCQSFDKIKNLIKNKDRVLIIEDSSHTYINTLNVLRKYNVLIKPGDYFIVEDGICYHGLDVGPKPGPYEAIEQFVSENKNFEIDRKKEAFFITWNPKGFLRRK